MCPIQESTTYFFKSRNFCIVLAFAGLSTITNVYPGGVDVHDLQVERDGALLCSLFGPAVRRFTLAGNASGTDEMDFFMRTLPLGKPEITNALPTPIPFINEYMGLP
jgi:hypothetical protein